MYEEQQDQQQNEQRVEALSRSVSAQEELMVKSEYKRRKQEILREHEISLKFLSGRGMLVRVGCKEVAFEDVSKGMEELTKYIENPFEEVKRWNQIFNQ